MRLDHLLSTENSGRCFAAGVVHRRPVGPVGGGLLVWNVVVGFVVWDALLGSRTATPVPCGWVGFVPARGRGLLVGSWFVGRAWWFENWIVDASKYFVLAFVVSNAWPPCGVVRIVL